MSHKRVRSDSRVRPRGLTGKAGVPGQRKELLARLKTAEETLAAIRSGEVDALMVSGRQGPKLVALAGGEPAYRILVEAMSEGAATLSRDGTVLYCNGRLAELTHRPPEKVIGRAVQSLIVPSERDKFEAVLAKARKRSAKGEFNLLRPDGSMVPVNLSLNRFRGYEGHALGMVVTDLSEQKRRQAEELQQAAKMHRLLLERTFAAQEEEGRRIARELHDESGQLLTSLLVGLRTLEDSEKIADAKAHGHRLRKLAAKAIEEIGRLARGLHPTVLDDHGLGVALIRYAAEYSEAHKISVRMTLDGLESSKLPPAVEIKLYRILQEALTNVARHSGARKVSITFARSATELTVAVIDDGCGFDAKSVAASSHRLGIQGMRERAAMLGGTVSYESRGKRNKGTKMTVQIPLHIHDLHFSGGGDSKWRRKHTRSR